MEKIEIQTDMINFSQLLKLIGIVESGGQVKYILEEQNSFLNGILITEKRKQIFPGDILEIKGNGKWEIIKNYEVKIDEDQESKFT